MEGLTVQRMVSQGQGSLPRRASQPTGSPISSASPPQSKLLDQVRQALRARHYNARTEEAYVGWIRRFIVFHGKRHPAEIGEPEINTFLTHLAMKERVNASTQNQAPSALLFLYRHVIGREVGDLGQVIRARKPTRLPVVLTRGEVKDVWRGASADGSMSHTEAFVCHAPHRSGLRDSDGARTPWPQGRADQDGLYARVEPGRSRCQKPDGCVGSDVVAY